MTAISFSQFRTHIAATSGEQSSVAPAPLAGSRRDYRRTIVRALLSVSWHSLRAGQVMVETCHFDRVMATKSDQRNLVARAPRFSWPQG